jgi:DNA-binding transcriptional ArsR family regulator
MDDAPMLRTGKDRADTTARHVLQAVAEYADDLGRRARPSVARIMYRTGYDRSTVQRALKRLRTAGLIKHAGREGGRDVWDLQMHLKRPETDWQATLDEVERERAADAERQRRSRQRRRVTHSESVTVTDSDGVTVTDSDAVTPPVTHPESGRHASDDRDVTHSESGCHAPSAPLSTNNHQDIRQNNLVVGVVVEGDGAREREAEAPSNPPAAREPFNLAPIDRDGFRLEEHHFRWATQTVPGVDVHHATALFVAHFRAEGVNRPNWFAEWQKWMLREAKFASERAARAAAGSNVLPFTGAPRPSTTDQRIQQAHAAAASVAAQMAAMRTGQEQQA